MNHDNNTGFLAAIHANGTVRFVYTKPVDNVALGNFLQILGDGTSVISRADGRVLRVVQPSGEIFEYSYSETTKQLCEIGFPDCSIWSSDSYGQWHARNKNTTLIKRLQFTPSVDQDGNLWLRDFQGVSRQYIRRSNSR